MADHELICERDLGGCGRHFGYGFHEFVVLRRLQRGEIQGHGHKVLWCKHCDTKWEVGPRSTQREAA